MSSSLATVILGCVVAVRPLGDILDFSGMPKSGARARQPVGNAKDGCWSVMPILRSGAKRRQVYACVLNGSANCARYALG